MIVDRRDVIAAARMMVMPKRANGACTAHFYLGREEKRKRIDFYLFLNKSPQQ
jgi:hypothetical protein